MGSDTLGVRAESGDQVKTGRRNESDEPHTYYFVENRKSVKILNKY